MNLDSIFKTTPEILAEYFNFLLEFAKQPGVALRPYAGKGSIDGKLFSFVVLSVGLSIVISVIANAIGVIEDTSAILLFVRSFDPRLLPIVAIVIILALALVIHPLANFYRLFGKVVPGAYGAYLGGSIRDSINALLGFSSFFTPITTSVISMLLIIAKQDPAIGLIGIPVLGTALAIVFIIYFPAALSATHTNTSWRQAMTALSLGAFFIFLILVFLDMLQRLLERPLE